MDAAAFAAGETVHFTVEQIGNHDSRNSISFLGIVCRFERDLTDNRDQLSQRCLYRCSLDNRIIHHPAFTKLDA